PSIRAPRSARASHPRPDCRSRTARTPDDPRAPAEAPAGQAYGLRPGPIPESCKPTCPPSSDPAVRRRKARQAYALRFGVHQHSEYAAARSPVACGILEDFKRRGVVVGSRFREARAIAAVNEGIGAQVLQAIGQRVPVSAERLRKAQGSRACREKFPLA